MINNYSNFNSIKLEEIPLFANYKTDTVYKYLRSNDISTLDELFNAHDNNSIYLNNTTNNIKKRTYGTIELLKYKYLGIPLKIGSYYEMKVLIFFYKDKIYNELNEEIPLSIMGFSKNEIGYLYNKLNNCKKGLTFIELLYIALDKLKESYKNDPHNDKSVKSYRISFISKLEILISYYEKIHDKNNSNMIEELEKIKKLRNLFSELSRLKVEKDKIENLIFQVENQIKEEIEIAKTR